MIRLQRYWFYKNWICGKNSIPLELRLQLLTRQYLYFRESLLVRSCISGKQAFSQCGEFIFQVFLLLVFENLLVSYIYLIYFSLILSFLFLELFFFFFLCYLFVLFSFSFKPVFFFIWRECSRKMNRGISMMELNSVLIASNFTSICCVQRR